MVADNLSDPAAEVDDASSGPCFVAVHATSPATMTIPLISARRIIVVVSSFWLD
jgi:hypothetical protein